MFKGVICRNPRPAKESKEGKSIPTQMLEKAEAHGHLMGHLQWWSVYLSTRFCSYLKLLIFSHFPVPLDVTLSPRN